MAKSIKLDTGKRIGLLLGADNHAVGIYNNSDWGEYIAIPGVMKGNVLIKSKESKWAHEDSKSDAFLTGANMLVPKGWSVCEAVGGGFIVLCNGYQQFGQMDHKLGCGTAVFSTVHEAISAVINK